MQNIFSEIKGTKTKRIFDISPKDFDRNNNLVAIFDADGTLIDRTKGDHWTAAINALPMEAQNRINQRIKLLAGSRETLHQKYLSASSLQEFVIAGINFEVVAPKVRVRKGVAGVFQYLHTKSIPVKIISHGSKDILEAVMNFNGLDFVEVYANHLPKNRIDIVPPFKSIKEMKTSDSSILDYVESIHVVPNTKNDILKSVIGNQHIPIAVGDSLGDIKMFRMSQELHGVAILNVDQDKGAISVTDNALSEMIPYLNYVTYNPIDYSFEPADELIKNLISNK